MHWLVKAYRVSQVVFTLFVSEAAGEATHYRKENDYD